MRTPLPAILLSLTLGIPATAEQVADPARAFTFGTQGSAAPGLVITGGASLEFTSGEYGRGTGTSLSADAYLEAEINGFYVGISREITDERTDNEDNLYLGYRRDLDSGLSYDVGYTRYFYPNDGGDCCGEITLGLYQSLGDSFALGLDLAIDPESSLSNAYLYGEYFLNDKITLSANYGVYEVDEAPSENEWDFGAGYAVNDELALDLRWYDGSEYDGYAAFLVSFDTTILGN